MRVGTLTVRCSGSNGELVTFRRKSKIIPVYTMKLTAKGRLFPPTLDGSEITLVMSTGGVDLRFVVDSCKLFGSQSVRCIPPL